MLGSHSLYCIVSGWLKSPFGTGPHHPGPEATCWPPQEPQRAQSRRPVELWLTLRIHPEMALGEGVFHWMPSQFSLDDLNLVNITLHLCDRQQNSHTSLEVRETRVHEVVVHVIGGQGYHQDNKIPRGQDISKTTRYHYSGDITRTRGYHQDNKISTGQDINRTTRYH